MKAVVKTKAGLGNVQISDMPVPEPKQGEIRIRVEAAGICGTDCKIYKDETWSNPPVILGHEFSGVVDALGPNVTGILPGTRVVSETAHVICGDCEYCKTGRYLMCKQRLSIGYGVNGAFARYIVVRKDLIHIIPDNVGFEEAALCEPFAVALHGVWDNANIQPTDLVLVSGPGSIGILAGIAAKEKGGQVILAGTADDAQRLKIATKLGIDYTTDNINEETLYALTGKTAVDFAIDCSGAGVAIDAALCLLKANGKLVQIGITPPTLEINYALMTAKELTISGVFGHRWHNWEQALTLLDRHSENMKMLITAQYPLEQWEHGFEEMATQQGIKVLLLPGNL